MGADIFLTMVEAWRMDDSEADERLPHKRAENEEVSLKELESLGVHYWSIKDESDPLLQEIREQYGYNYSDYITVSPTAVPDYEEKCKIFYKEHLHDDDEIRLCLEGSGYFDVRASNEDWIRIWVKENDMISLPAGIYHRFTLDESNYVKAMRLFIGEPIWTAHHRPADDREARSSYITKFNSEK